MLSISPSGFVTFYRRAATPSSQILRASTRTPLRPAPKSIRNFSLSTAYSAQDKDQEHATKKDNRIDVQSSNAKSGMDAQKSGTGGNATEGKDSAGGKAKAKREFPEAPDVAIGMQDERGGRGG